MMRFNTLALCAAMLLGGMACDSAEPESNQEPVVENQSGNGDKPSVNPTPDPEPTPAEKPKKTYAEFKTNLGEFTILLFTEQVPVTTTNFIELAKGEKEWTDPKTGDRSTEPFYDGLIFHRVIDGFMIQGGCPLGRGAGSPGYRFRDEFHPKLRHSKPGILSMANSGPNTNGSQFFITVAPTPHLDGRHSVFGEVVEGMDVVYTIAKVKTGAQNRPVEPVVIETVKIVEK